MAGAYVAKPAVVVPPPGGPPTVDDVPPGWDLNWLFPGPYPPGYAPELTLPMTATGTIRFFGTAAVTGEFRDHVDFATKEPDAVILTAAIGGVAVNLRFFGNTEYASSISSDSTLGDYWNIAPDIEFELSRNQEGSVVVLTGTSAVDGTTVVGTANIAIYLPDYSLVMSGTESMDYDETASVTVSLKDHDTLETNEPTGSTLTWTATLDGAAVNLRFSGDPGYSSSISSSYSDIGDYWGAEEDIEFDLEIEDRDKTVILKVESTVWEEELSDEVEIEIEGLYVVSYSASAVAGTFTPVPDAYLGANPTVGMNVYRTPDTQRDTAQMSDLVMTDGNPDPDPIEWTYYPTVRDNIVENVCTAEDSTIAASCAACVSGKTYRVAFYANPGGTNYDRVAGSVTFSITVILSDDSEITHSVVKSIVDKGPSVGAQLLIVVDTAETTWTE